MLNQLKILWRDQNGFVVTLEMILIATITGLGLIVGLTMVRDAVVAELSDLAQSIESLDLFGDGDSTATVEALDPLNEVDTCIAYSIPPTEEL